MAATQTYSDGEVVRWDQPTVVGQPEPDKPAPTVTLGAPTADGHADTATHKEDTQTAAENSASSDTDSTDDTARWLAGAGILLGALGIGVAIGALARKRQ